MENPSCGSEILMRSPPRPIKRLTLASQKLEWRDAPNIWQGGSVVQILTNGLTKVPAVEFTVTRIDNASRKLGDSPETIESHRCSRLLPSALNMPLE